MQKHTAPTRPAYRERLAPGLWALVSMAVVGPMIALVFVPAGAIGAIFLGAGAAVLLLVLAVFLSPTVSVEKTELRAGRAHIDARWLGEPVALTGEEARLARGAQLSALSWHLLRGGIDGVVVVPLTDPDDPVPNWTISSRTPDRLSAAITAARVRAASEITVPAEDP